MRIALTLALLFVQGSMAYGQSSKNAVDALRAADLAWEHAWATHDLKAAVAMFDTAASFLPPNDKAATDPKAITAAVQSAFSVPDFHLSWTPNRVSVAQSGELGVTSGTYDLTFRGPGGKPIADKGKYVTVWKKVSGQWKVIVDTYNSDLPPST